MVEIMTRMKSAMNVVIIKLDINNFYFRLLTWIKECAEIDPKGQEISVQMLWKIKTQLAYKRFFFYEIGLQVHLEEQTAPICTKPNKVTATNRKICMRVSATMKTMVYVYLLSNANSCAHKHQQ